MCPRLNPEASATRSSVVPSRPSSPTHRVTASRICSRRSAAMLGRPMPGRILPAWLFVSLDNQLARLSRSRSRAGRGAAMPDGFERTTEEPVPDTATQHMVRMRDGIRLATDVYLPADPAPAEAVLVRLPYDKNSRYVFFRWVAE